MARENRLARALASHPGIGSADVAGEDRFDYVLIDCPPSLGLLTLNALVAGAEVMIPIQAEYYALEGLGQLLETIEMVRAHLNPRLTVSSILITMYDARTRLAAGVADEVREHFADQVLKTTIPRSVRVSEAPSYGQTVMTYDPASPGSAVLSGSRSRGGPAGDPADDQGGAAMSRERPTVRRGLGRGLGSLIPTAPADEAPTGDARLRPVRRRPGPTWSCPRAAGSRSCRPDRSCRTACSPARSSTRTRWPSSSTRSARWACSSRSSSGRCRGRETPSYELVMGERRWRAAQQAGLERIPAIVRATDDTDMLRDALLENLHRSQLNPLEEAAAYQQLLEDFGCTHDELAQRIGRSRPQISNTIRLLKLSPAVQRRVAAGVLSAGHARSLLGVENAEQQDRLASRVVAEGISVRGLEEIVATGGGDALATPAVRRNKPVAPGLTDLADRLSDRLETRVKVELGRHKGKITVEFASLDDLRRIVDIMDPRNRSDRPI